MKITCPYCQSVQSLHPEVGSEHAFGNQLVMCDPETGGCDQYYAVFWSVHINTTVVPLQYQHTQKDEP